MKTSKSNVYQKLVWSIPLFLIVLTLLIVGLRYSDTGQLMLVKVHQYIDKNKPQNSGVHYYILSAAEVFLTTTSRKPLIEYDDTKMRVGFTPNKHINPVYTSHRNIILVNNEQQLYSVIKTALPADEIRIMSGEYTINTPIKLGSDGHPGKPIIVTADQPGKTVLNINTTEGVYIDKAHWQFNGIVFRGTCTEHKRCEHAMHFYGDADYNSIINNQFIDFNAAIKSNGNYQRSPAVFPDNVTIESNDFYNTTVRKTDTPSSPIDIVGGNNWHVKDNFIADFSRRITNRVSVTYGAFMKGGGQNGVFESNVVNCAWKLPYQSHLDVRIGLSFGNGGTEQAYCQSNECESEHSGGKIINNVVINCVNDVSIYLNKAAATQIKGNTLLNSLGVDARFKATSVSFVNNTIQGRIRSRDGAFISERDNVMVQQ